MSEIDDHLNVLIRELSRSIAAQIIQQLPTPEAPAALEYLTSRQVAEMSGFTEKALESLRARREGAPFLKIGVCVRYRASDVRAWIEGGGR